MFPKTLAIATGPRINRIAKNTKRMRARTDAPIPQLFGFLLFGMELGARRLKGRSAETGKNRFAELLCILAYRRGSGESHMRARSCGRNRLDEAVVERRMSRMLHPA